MYPKDIATMLEEGFNISHHTSNNIEELYILEIIITVRGNAKECCPFFPTKAKNLLQFY